jgi:murein DD-endopeptidase MepM/ murein hydrolase activator NlpD
MSVKYLTLLLVPHDEGNVRRIRLSYRRLQTAAVLLGLAAIVAGGAALAYGRVSARAMRAAMLERENARLSAENAKVEELAANLQRIEAAYRQIRDMAGLAPPDELEVSAAPLIAAGAIEPVVAGPAARGPETVPGGWPLSTRGFVTARFTGVDRHPGVDIAAPANTPVLATGSGKVKQTGSDRVLGNFVVIGHEAGFDTLYAHNAHVLVRRGETVGRGETIAYSGNSGRSTAPHLHYEVRRDGLPVDPFPYLR